MRELKIDGVQYNSIVCNVERTATMEESDISGRMLDKRYFNDVLGTYMRYTVEVIVPLGEESKYSQLYETLTEPVGEHLFVMPYNQGTITFYGKVETVSDKYIRRVKDNAVWRDTKFDCIATRPSKEESLGDVIYKGISDLPPVTELDDGKIYMVVHGEWVETTLRNGDEDYY